MSAQKRDQPKPPRRPAPKPQPSPNRDKPVRGWARSKFGQAGRGRSGK